MCARRARRPDAAAAAKRLFRDLDGVQLAAQKKDAAVARKFFAYYADDMPALLKKLAI